MKKTIFALIFIVFLACGVFSQSSGPMDIVVLLDTSASMSNSYRETSDYLIGPFLREYLRLGDTFHLISFAGKPKVEISRRIEAVGDVEAVIGRLLLMYPLDPESDLSGALSFTESYSSSLPGNRAKKVVLLSDGDIPGTQNLVNASSGRLKSKGTDLQYIKVPVTGTGPSSGRPAQSAVTPSASQTSQARAAPASSAQPSQASGAASSGATAASASSSAAATGTTAAAGSQTQSSQAAAASQTQTTPGSASSSGTQAQPSQAGAAQSGGQTDSRQTSPENQQTGTSSGTQASRQEPAAAVSSTGQPGSSSAVQTQPAPSSGQTSQQASSSAPSQAQGQTSAASAQASSGGSFFTDGIPLPLLILLGILALLLLGLIIFLTARHLQNSPNRAMAQAAVPGSGGKDSELMESYAEAQRKQERPPLEYPARKQKPMPKDKIYTGSLYDSGNGGPAMLNLFVEDQNTAIGRRNIHAVKSGYSFSVGGGRSDFLIFLVPIPPHIADVVLDGNSCTFVPRKPQYFPDIGSQSVSNCIGKTIRVISDKNYELHIRIERYEDPLKALNKLLHSISVPGEVKQ